MSKLVVVRVVKLPMQIAYNSPAAGIRHAGYGSIQNLYNVDVEDLDILFRPLLVSPGILDLVYHIQALDGTTENSVLVVEPRLFISLAEPNPHEGRSQRKYHLLSFQS